MVGESQMDNLRHVYGSTTHPERPEEPELRHLLDAVNDASSSARQTWIFFLALSAYFFLAIAGVSHTDLFLNSPVKLPFLGIGLALSQFFMFAPLVFLLVHFGFLVQHVLLAQKLHKLNELLAEQERRSDMASNAMRLELHSYFYSQLIAGAKKGRTFDLFLRGMQSISFVILPVVLLLYFQFAFLSYHDTQITAFHRIYILLDLLIIYVVRANMATPLAQSWAETFRTALRLTLVSSLSTLFVATTVLLSFCVATIPDARLDSAMTRIPAFTHPVPVTEPSFLGIIRLISPLAIISDIGRLISGRGPDKTHTNDGQRRAFFLTAYLFEGAVDLGKGTSQSLFSRNLIVTDQDLVADAETERGLGSEGADDAPEGGINRDLIRSSGPRAGVKQGAEVSLSLRGRDFRYATLDRSALQRADFTGANLIGASLKGTDLRAARLSCPQVPRTLVFRGEARDCTNLERANLSEARLQNADLRHAALSQARLERANLRQARLAGADLSSADLSFADLRGANLVEAQMQSARFLEAKLQGANLRFAKLQLADFSEARLQGANLTLVRAEGASFRSARLDGATLRLAWLQGGDFVSAKLQGADLSSAKLQSADLSSTSLEAADLSSAELHGANLNGASIRGVDLRHAQLWGTTPPPPPPPKGTVLAELTNLKFDELSVRNREVLKEIVKEIDKKLKQTQNRVGARNLRLKEFFALSRLTSLLHEARDRNWKAGANYATWQYLLKRSVEDSAKRLNQMGSFLTALACFDRTRAGYVAQSIIRRVNKSGPERAAACLLTGFAAGKGTPPDNSSDCPRDALRIIDINVRTNGCPTAAAIPRRQIRQLELRAAREHLAIKKRWEPIEADAEPAMPQD